MTRNPGFNTIIIVMVINRGSLHIKVDLGGRTNVTINVVLLLTKTESNY